MVADVTECVGAGGHLYLLRVGDLWMFPALGSGAAIPVKVANRTYVVRNLSRQPKVRGPLASMGEGPSTKLTVAPRDVRRARGGGAGVRGGRLFKQRGGGGAACRQPLVAYG